MKKIILGILLSYALKYVYDYCTYKYNENYARAVCLRTLEDIGYFKNNTLDSYTECDKNISINKWYMDEK